MDTDYNARTKTIITIFLGKQYEIFTNAKFLVSAYHFQICVCLFVYLIAIQFLAYV